MLKHLTIVAFALLALGGLALCSVAAESSPLWGASSPRADGDDCWSESFTAPFPEGEPGAAVVYGGQLIIGGYFEDPIGGFPQGLMAWNGERWERFAADVYGDVSALAVWNGMLIAGGDFIVAGNAGANRIAAWNGSSWQGLGQGLDGPVEALAVYGSELIAGGEFTFAGSAVAERIAAWNGTSWRALGDGFNADVNCLAPYAGKLIASGDFTRTGTQIVNHIAAWDGAAWQALGWGTDGAIEALAVHDNKLIVGGNYIWAGSAMAFGLAAWNGASWSTMGLTEESSVNALYTHGALLVASGYLNGSSAGVFVWDGSWSELGAFTVQPQLFAAYDGELVALKSMYYGSVPGMAWAWDGSAWRALMGEGLSGSISALVEWNGLLVAGGEFALASGQSAGGIAAWDGGHWQTFAGGFIGEDYSNPVLALAVYDGELYAGGRFEFAAAGGPALNGIARWDGIAWQPLGQGFGSSYGGNAVGSVYALASFAGKLVAGGAIECNDLGDERGIAAWNGSAWESLGGGCLYYGSATIRALEILDATHLIAAGDLSEIGGTYVDNIAVWDGSGWGDLDGGVDGPVYDLCLTEQGLAVAGEFALAGGVDTAGLALWGAGTGWTSLISELDPFDEGSSPGSVRGIAMHDEHLVATGYFSAVNGVPAACIAYLDASTWAPLGSGIVPTGTGNVPVSALLVFQEALHAGGNFTVAGGKPSYYLARYDCGLPIDANAVPAVADLLLNQNYPNPFNPSTTISWSQPAAGAVSLSVVDIAGRRVRTLLAGDQRDAGSQEAVWDGRDDRGIPQSSGVYFCRLDCAGQTNARSMLLVK